ncbi:putative bifunctional diguanylate cyclase/phosphodiesterase [Pseudazoarcus pumilus]|uniref:GGDEF domain-containing protein n=1 Tax=Pseudazoarcus pumilus TaxID=2067960 RepID=A0A2I6SA59_9RHOO|nr:EAL domain-containing protein [Pseudazoarcus pumilus]AUN96148.1 GGDEF domain-containing protein [Pseudazoarcus pumilus]
MSFGRRLLLVMLAVVLVSQLVSAVAILRTIERDVLSSGGRELDVGLSVLRQLLDERGKQLRDNVSILTADFGFRSAVATEDANTLISVLANHGDRAGADMVLLTDPQGTLLAGSHHARGTALPFEAAWRQARDEAGSVGVVLEEGRPYQFVLLPVMAPNLIGWVGMGFLLDEALAREIANLTRLSASFVVDSGASAQPWFVTSLDDGGARLDPGALRAALAAGDYLDGSGFDARLDYLNRAAMLHEGDDGRAYAVASVARDRLLATYRELRWQLLGIFALTLAFAAAVAMLSARGVSRPLGVLADAARRIGRGERLERIEVPRQSEIALLADTMLVMQDDIDEREASLLHRSRHDQLTDLANRSSAQQDIEVAIAAGAPFVLLRLAINGFRAINDTFGYALGDRVLTTLAGRLAGMPPPARTAYRLGGDEFLLLLDGAGIDPQWLQRLQREMAEPIDLRDSPIRPSVSVGEVGFPEHGDSPTLLLRRAEVALEAARSARVHHQRYAMGQDEQHLRQLTLIRDLQEAVGRGQLAMVFQPKLRAADGELVEFEALMRWQHAELGFIPADEFIGLAERSGNIHLLTGWMIEAVCAHVAAWEAQGQRVCVAVNLSAHDVIDTALPARILEVLNKHALTTERLSLEVTESAIMQDAELALRTLEALRAAGMSIAVDDYGTGYSSLAQLKRMPVQQLKIDKSFILRLDDGGDDAIIVRSTIEMGHNLGLEVVAEGVETPASRELLRELGCDYLQGYLISRPVAAEEVPAWIAQHQGGADAAGAQGWAS